MRLQDGLQPCRVIAEADGIQIHNRPRRVIEADAVPGVEDDLHDRSDPPIVCAQRFLVNDDVRSNAESSIRFSLFHVVPRVNSAAVMYGSPGLRFSKMRHSLVHPTHPAALSCTGNDCVFLIRDIGDQSFGG